VALSATLAVPHAAAGSRARTDEDSARCDASRNLLRRWGPLSSAAKRGDEDAAWRQWNHGERRAVHAVSERTVALLKVQSASCTTVARPRP
jgi:hypothetical protein